ncbi:MAG TPA: SHOCT domain-containing protein, partial [Acholeplasmataceae bacterium]|nr:SHOCT domain-containing protein [Acholeplasmataceae bacterium]
TIANIKDYNEKLATSSMPNQSVDVSAKLKELEALFDQGLISNEEYYTKREDILNQLS